MLRLRPGPLDARATGGEVWGLGADGEAVVQAGTWGAWGLCRTGELLGLAEERGVGFTALLATVERDAWTYPGDAR